MSSNFLFESVTKYKRKHHSDGLNKTLNQEAIDTTVQKGKAVRKKLNF